jgi:GT2 family glycosyltransferase
VPEPEATIVIVTKDRRDDAAVAVRSALEQLPPVEVLVVDDGSSDGTSEALREAFPAARVERFEESAGYIVRRNEAAGLASGRILVSIDDDAEFRSNDVVARTVADFDEPRVGVVAIPYVDLPDERVLQRAPAPDGVFLIHRFRGTAYAVLRDVFLQVGGFRTSLVHQAEEADFSLRLLDAGYVVRVGNAEPIHHSASPNRNMERVWSYECRNGVLFAWHNVPMPDLVLQLLRTTLHMLWLGRGVGRTGLFARGLFRGFVDALPERRARRPVARNVWRLYRVLGKGPTRIEDATLLADSQSAARRTDPLDHS